MEVEEMQEQRKITESPFIFRKEMVLIHDELYSGKKGKELSQGAFLRLEEKNVINEFDRSIIKSILKMGFATNRSIKQTMESSHDCKKALKKLCDNGVLERYHYVYEADGFKRNTVNFYGLGGAAKRISIMGLKNCISMGVNRMVQSFSYEEYLDNPVKLLRCLEMNNFDAFFMNDYGKIITKKYVDYVFKRGNTTYRQQYMYSITKSDPEALVKELLIIPICIRRNAGWRKEVFSVMSHIMLCLEKSFPDKTPVFILNTEDNTMACEAEAGVAGYQNLASATIFYISDWSVNNSPVLDNLIHVVNAQKENYDVVKLQI